MVSVLVTTHLLTTHHSLLPIKRLQQLPPFVDAIRLSRPERPPAAAVREEGYLLEIGDSHAGHSLAISRRDERFLAKEVAHRLRLDLAVAGVVQAALQAGDVVFLDVRVRRLPAGKRRVNVVRREIAQVRNKGVGQRPRDADVAERPLPLPFQRYNILEAEQKALHCLGVARPENLSLIE